MKDALEMLRLSKPFFKLALYPHIIIITILYDDAINRSLGGLSRRSQWFELSSHTNTKTIFATL